MIGGYFVCFLADAAVSQRLVRRWFQKATYARAWGGGWGVKKTFCRRDCKTDSSRVITDQGGKTKTEKPWSATRQDTVLRKYLLTFAFEWNLALALPLASLCVWVGVVGWAYLRCKFIGRWRCGGWGYTHKSNHSQTFRRVIIREWMWGEGGSESTAQSSTFPKIFANRSSSAALYRNSETFSSSTATTSQPAVSHFNNKQYKKAVALPLNNTDWWKEVNYMRQTMSSKIEWWWWWCREDMWAMVDYIDSEIVLAKVSARFFHRNSIGSG